MSDEVAASHKALVIPRKHASALEIISMPTPAVGAQQVLIRVTCAGINPLDWKLFHGVLDVFNEYPAVLGHDGAGIVEAIGADVTTFNVGDRVFFQSEIGNIDSAAFQEYALVPARYMALIPDCITDEEAASVPIAGLAAFIALYDTSGLQLPPFWTDPPNPTPTAILIAGGSSNVGQWAVQFAKLSGFTTIITTASLKHSEMLHRLGATHLVDRNLTIDNQRTAIVQINGHLRLAFDAVSLADTQALLYSCLNEDDDHPAKLVLTLPAQEAVLRMAHASESISHILGSAYMHRDLGTTFWRIIPALLTTGSLACGPIERLPGWGLDTISQGIEQCRRGVSGVKLVGAISQ